MALLRPKSKPVEPANRKFDTLLVTTTSSAASRNLQNIQLIIKREYNARVRKRSFVIATGVLLVIIFAAAFAPTVISLLTSGSQTKLAVISNTGPVAGQDINANLNSRLNVTLDNTTGQPKPAAANQKPAFNIQTFPPSELEVQRKRVRDGKLDGVLQVGRNQTGDLTFDYYTSGGLGNSTYVKVRSAANEINFLDKLARLGVAPNQLAGVFSQPEFRAASSTEERSGRNSAENLAAYFIVLGGITLIFSTLIQYGVAVAQGAVEEKSSRVMEIMINAATPFQLMAGKIIGIGLAGFTQVATLVAGGIIAFSLRGPLESALLGNTAGSEPPLNISNLSIGMLLLMLVFYVLGFMLYATLFAAVGSLISRQEDVQGATAPLTFLFVIGFYAAIFGLQDIEASWVIFLSFVPFFSPMLMLARAGLGYPAAWEIGLSVVLMLGAIVVCTWMAARVYRAGVLMYGQKATLGTLFKLIRAS